MMAAELKQGFLQWSFSHSFPLLLSPSSYLKPNSFKISAAVESLSENLTAKERRQLRNSRRESKANNWKEEVEERLIQKPKKKGSWTEELNLDKLAELGPQWWVVRVSRMAGSDVFERLARVLARKFPTMDFKVYVPAVQIKKKLKNGTVSVKPKYLFPGCLFLRCIMNKDVHDYVRDECDGTGGFVGAKVGNTKRQINKPRPVDAVDLEEIYARVKQEQAEADEAFMEESQVEESLEIEKLISEPVTASSLPAESVTHVKAKGRPRKAAKVAITDQLSESDNINLPIPGSTVQVLAGSFAGFSATVKKCDPKTGLVTVSLTMFGKETLADLEVSEITAEMTSLAAE